MKKDYLIILPLIFFGLVLVVSIGLILISNKNNGNNKIGNIKTKPAIFKISGKNEIEVNSQASFDFIVNTNNQEVNAVALEVNFDPQKLEVVNVNTSQSFCQFYPENKFNNNLGTIAIQCGAPNPGFKGENKIAQIHFYTKNIGQTNLEIKDSSMILLNNGRGTNVFSEPIVHKISILNRI